MSAGPLSAAPAGGVLPRDQVLIVAVAALAFRALFLALYRGSPFFHVPVVDASTFDLWARALVAGQQFQPDVFFKPPLFPYLLSVFYRIFGPQVTPVYVFHAVLGCGTAVLALGIGRLLLPARTALAGALVCALLPMLPFFEFQLLAETVTVFLSMLALLVLLRGLATNGGPNPRQALTAGILFGVAALGRPNLMLVPLALAVWLWLHGRRTGGGALRPALLLVAGLAVALLPTTIRNLGTGGGLVPVSANAGANLWAGIHPGADGVSPIQVGYRWDDLQLRCDEAGARGAAAASRYLTRLALKEAAADPARAAGLVLKKAVVMVGAHEGRNNIGAGFLAREQGVFVLDRFWPGFWLMAPLALLGIVGVLRTRLLDGAPAGLGMRLLLVYAAALAVSVLPFFVNARFRLPLLPVLALFAAHGGAGLAASLRGGGPLRAGGGLAVLALAAALVNVDWYGLDGLKTAARDEFNLAAIHAKGYAGNPPDLRLAEEHYRRAAAIDPADADIPERHGLMWMTAAQPLIEQAERAGRQGDTDIALARRRQAVPLLERALERHEEATRMFPRAFRSHANVGNCNVWLGDGARDMAVHAAALGDEETARARALEALGHYNASGRAYQRSLDIKPDQRLVQANLPAVRRGILDLPPLDPAIVRFQSQLR